MKDTQEVHKRLGDLIDHQIVGSDHRFARTGYSTWSIQERPLAKTLSRGHDLGLEACRGLGVTFLGVTDDIDKIASGFSAPADDQRGEPSFRRA